MAGKQQRQRSKGRSARGTRWGLWITLAAVSLAVLALPALRVWWRHEAGNPLREGLAALEVEGCTGCHWPPGGALRWRTEGEPPSVEAVRTAILDGRPAAAGFPAAMPAYGERLAQRGWQPAALAVAATTGLVGTSDDPETAAGLEILEEMGCYGCHGLLGAGGVPNPGSLLGEVPGFYGDRVARLSAQGALAAVIRNGATPRRLPPLGFAPPPLQMPAYGGRLDSTELELARRAVEWLNEDPPRLP